MVEPAREGGLGRARRQARGSLGRGPRVSGRVAPQLGRQGSSDRPSGPRGNTPHNERCSARSAPRTGPCARADTRRHPEIVKESPGYLLWPGLRSGSVLPAPPGRTTRALRATPLRGVCALLRRPSLRSGRSHRPSPPLRGSARRPFREVSARARGQPPPAASADANRLTLADIAAWGFTLGTAQHVCCSGSSRLSHRSSPPRLEIGAGFAPSGLLAPDRLRVGRGGSAILGPAPSVRAQPAVDPGCHADGVAPRLSLPVALVLALALRGVARATLVGSRPCAPRRAGLTACAALGLPLGAELVVPWLRVVSTWGSVRAQHQGRTAGRGLAVHARERSQGVEVCCVVRPGAFQPGSCWLIGVEAAGLDDLEDGRRLTPRGGAGLARFVVLPRVAGRLGEPTPEGRPAGLSVPSGRDAFARDRAHLGGAAGCRLAPAREGRPTARSAMGRGSSLPVPVCNVR